MDRIGERTRRPSPISVYRALDFLVANRFAHRIESATLPRLQPGARPLGQRRRTVAGLLLCESCGSATEAEPAALGDLLSGIAASHGFKPSTSVLEIRGLCAACRAGDQAHHDHSHHDHSH